ncbi:hypothetical protein SXHG_00035 [Synechococcus phage MRHenn-2013a]|nr:hypothetical protein SXHG_00035 [Synechococcus phage MRHenn-2013a]
MSTQQVTKPFNLEAAKAGKPVCTKWGLPARIVCWDYKNPDNRLIVLVNTSGIEHVFFYNEQGHRDGPRVNEYDLRMVPEILTQWINILEAVDSFGIIKSGFKQVCYYGSEEEAKRATNSYSPQHWKIILLAKRVDIEL